MREKDQLITELRKKIESRNSMMDSIRNSLYKEVLLLKEKLRVAQIFGPGAMTTTVTNRDGTTSSTVSVVAPAGGQGATTTITLNAGDLDAFSFLDWMQLFSDEAITDDKRKMMAKLQDAINVQYTNLSLMFAERLKQAEKRLAEITSQFHDAYLEISHRLLVMREQSQVNLPFDRPRHDEPPGPEDPEVEKQKKKIRKLKAFLEQARQEHETLVKKLIVLAKRVEYNERERKNLSKLDASMEARAPDGWIYMVFLDIQGSTAMWEAVPDTMEVVVETFMQVLKKLCDKYLGYWVKNEGDALFIVFGDVFNAVNFAMEVQLNLMEEEWPSVIYTLPAAQKQYDRHGNLIFKGIRARCGVYKGNPKRVKDGVTQRFDYFGRSVNSSARVSGAASGGQVFVSSLVFEEIKDFLAKLVGTPVWKDCGSHLFKGLTNPEVCIELLPAKLAGRSDTFPPLTTNSGHTLSESQSHLKEQLTKLEVQIRRNSSGGDLLTPKKKASVVSHVSSILSESGTDTDEDPAFGDTMSDDEAAQLKGSRGNSEESLKSKRKSSLRKKKKEKSKERKKSLAQQKDTEVDRATDEESEETSDESESDESQQDETVAILDDDEEEDADERFKARMLEYKRKVDAEYSEKEAQLEEKMKQARKLLMHLLASLDEKELLQMQSNIDPSMQSQVRGCDARIVRLRRDIEQVFSISGTATSGMTGPSAAIAQSIGASSFNPYSTVSMGGPGTMGGTMYQTVGSGQSSGSGPAGLPMLSPKQLQQLQQQATIGAGGPAPGTVGTNFRGGTRQQSTPQNSPPLHYTGSLPPVARGQPGAAPRSSSGVAHPGLGRQSSRGAARSPVNSRSPSAGEAPRGRGGFAQQPHLQINTPGGASRGGHRSSAPSSRASSRPGSAHRSSSPSPQVPGSSSESAFAEDDAFGPQVQSDEEDDYDLDMPGVESGGRNRNQQQQLRHTLSAPSSAAGSGSAAARNQRRANPRPALLSVTSEGDLSGGSSASASPAASPLSPGSATGSASSPFAASVKEKQQRAFTKMRGVLGLLRAGRSPSSRTTSPTSSGASLSGAANHAGGSSSSHVRRGPSPHGGGK
jgi:class 3 adenylate cyclase